METLKLLKQLGLSPEEMKERIASQLIDELRDSCWSSIKQTIIKETQEQVKVKVDALLVEEAQKVLTNEFPVTNSWGEPTGESTSIRDTLAQRAKDWWNTKVDSSGNPSTYGNSQTRAEYYSKNILKDLYMTELRESARTVADEMKLALKEHLKTHLANKVLDKIWR